MDKSDSNLIKIRYLTKLLFITDMSRRGRSEVTLLRLYNFCTGIEKNLMYMNIYGQKQSQSD